MIALGIDAATKTGWALVERVGGRDRHLASGVISGVSHEAVSELAGRIVNSPAAPDIVAIEDNYLAVDPSALKVLARIVGRFQQAFESMGVTTRLVMPATWRSGVLKGLATGKDRAAWKIAAALFCKSALGVALTGDAADACCLATFAARMHDKESWNEAVA